jgi:HAD superfamily hydrolase (TIGR01509 family)
MDGREDVTIEGHGGKVNDLTLGRPLAIIAGIGPVEGPCPCEDAMPTRAVLFDFDGVIADTENVHVAAWQRTFGVMGWMESDESCARAAEIDDRAFVAEVFARRKIEEGNVEGWVARKQELTLRLLADAPSAYPGVVALVGRLRGQVRLGVVTTTWRGNVEVVLRTSGLLAAFEFIVAKEDVIAPKPDPEGYRLALAKLGLPASDVVALEDSPSGLAAARAAGTRVVAVGHRKGRGEWAAGSAFVADFAEPVRVLEALGVELGR